VVAIFGPTAVGKTAVAAKVAQALGNRVISCDSMQLYRGFPVLTNQPSAAERLRAPHELVGVASPSEEWTAAVYAARARELIDEDVARGRALLCGGTGLYMRAALGPLAIPEVHDPKLRARLNERAAVEGPEVLYSELEELDPEAARRIHPHNLRRIVRAVEVLLSTGAGTWSGRSDLWRPEYWHACLVIGLTLEREELHRRIALRSARMLVEGAVDEVARNLAARGITPGEHLAQPVTTGVYKALGYGDICRYLAGLASLDEVAARLSQATRRYARAQHTWLRRLEGAVIMDAQAGAEAVAGDILALLEGEQRPASG
jgi:tRNA dimethylallyltransferase